MNNFFDECRRRGVFPVAAIYVASAWVILEVASLAFESWGIAPERLQHVWLVAIIGFPVALIGGWRYDLVGGRITKTPQSADDTHTRLSKFDYALFAAMVVAVTATATVLLSLDTSKHTADASIAVLPFADLSPEGDQMYFADGIAEETLNLLAKYDGLTVISRSSAFAMRDAALTTPEVASKLGTRHILEGSVRKSGDTVRITAQLVDAYSDSQLWSETYERQLEDVFEIQDDVARQVARELKARLLVAAPRSQSTDTRAHDLYLRGLSLLARRDIGDAAAASALFEQVIELDPEYSPAWGSLAMAKFWAFAAPDEILNSALAALDRDSGNSDALAVRGRLASDAGDATVAREYFRESIKANPSNPMPIRWLAVSYSDVDPTQYLTYARNALAIDPLDPSIHWHIAIAAQFMGHFDEAASAAEMLVDSIRYSMGLQYMAMIHESSGDLASAAKTRYIGYVADTERVMPWWRMPSLLVDLGEFDLAAQWIDEFEKLGGDTLTTYIVRAQLAALDGDHVAAVRIVSDGEVNGVFDPMPLAVTLLVRTGDVSRARSILEESIGDWRGLATESILEDWVRMRVYAMTLVATGDGETASLIIDILIPHLEELRDKGVVRTQFFSLSQTLAELYAVRGDRQKAYMELRSALSKNMLTCRECLALMPVWDPYRDDPEFVEILEAQQRYLESQRQQLEDEGLLLTPEQAAAMGDLDFDPFTR